MTTPFDQIEEFISEYAGDEFIEVEAGTAASAADIKKLESNFGSPFPAIYREYLSKFGTLEPSRITGWRMVSLMPDSR